MERVRSMGIGLAIAAGALLVGSAHADTNPFVGRWHWNHTQSTLPPGEPAPDDLVTEISSDEDEKLRWSVTITAEGQTHDETFDAVANGEFHPVGDKTTAAFRLLGDSLQATFKGPSGQSDTFTCTISEDRRKMTCKGTVDQGDGKAANYTDVYDRM